MIKQEFKEQIDNFLLEIQKRGKEISNGQFNPTFQVGKNLYAYARKNLNNDDLPIVYSVGSIRLDYIFHRDDKTKLFNASNYQDIIRLFYAVKYEILANKTIFKDITLDDFYYVYFGYLIRLSRNFNWTTTFNGDEVLYLNWMNDEKQNILSDFAIEHTYKKIFIDNDNIVLDIKGVKKEINTKNSDYRTMKKLSKEELVSIIETFEDKPTVRQIRDYYMENMSDKGYLSPDSIRKYVKSYEIEDMIKTCKHSDKFNNKQSK